MKDQIKVLMVVPNLRVSNGVASYAMNYFRQLKDIRVHMDFAVYRKWDNPYEEEIEATGSKVFLLPPIDRIPAHVKGCIEVLQRGQYDVIHDNSLLVTYPMMKLAKKYVPVRILHSHNSKLGETPNKEKRNAFFLPLLLKQANAYAACSDLAAKAMFGNKAYKFIPNFIDSDDYKFDLQTRNQIRLKMGVEGKKVIATVGRVAAQKNPFFALDVFDRLADKEEEVEYWWIGSGPLDQKVADYAGKLKHADRVKLLGSRNDVPDLYQAMDIFFLPSLFEGLPVTGVETQAMGLPSVVSDTVTKEMVYTDLVEYVSLEQPIDDWVAALERQIARIPDRRSYTKELKESVFSADSAGQRLEEYYKSLLKE